MAIGPIPGMVSFPFALGLTREQLASEESTIRDAYQAGGRDAALEQIERLRHLADQGNYLGKFRTSNPLYEPAQAAESLGRGVARVGDWILGQVDAEAREVKSGRKGNDWTKPLYGVRAGLTDFVGQTVKRAGNTVAGVSRVVAGDKAAVDATTHAASMVAQSSFYVASKSLEGQGKAVSALGMDSLGKAMREAGQSGQGMVSDENRRLNGMLGQAGQHYLALGTEKAASLVGSSELADRARAAARQTESNPLVRQLHADYGHSDDKLYDYPRVATRVMTTVASMFVPGQTGADAMALSQVSSRLQTAYQGVALMEGLSHKAQP